MALMKDVILPAGTNLADFFPETDFETVVKKDDYLANNMYIKIERIGGTKESQEIIVVFKKDRDSESLMVKTYTFTPSLEENAGNLFEQGYDYLKSLQEFKGALDIED